MAMINKSRKVDRIAPTVREAPAKTIRSRSLLRVSGLAESGVAETQSVGGRKLIRMP